MTTATGTELELIEMIGVQTRLTSEEEQVLLTLLREAKTLATGPEGEAFEKEFTAFTGSADAVCLSNCSSALELSAILTGIGPGEEVIIPAHTFVATAVPFGRTGATIRWADIDPDTRVVDAVAAGDPQRTAEVVREHIKHPWQEIKPRVRSPGSRPKGNSRPRLKQRTTRHVLPRQRGSKESPPSLARRSKVKTEGRGFR